MKRINVNTKIWNVLSMTYKSNVPLLFKNKYYKDIYHCIYANIFPSKHDEIVESSIRSLKEKRLSLEKFEITEEECFNILMEIIDVKYNTDLNFKIRLNKTKNKKIMNYDFSDFYFGHPNNIYGIALMKYRDKLNEFHKINAIK